MSIRPAKSIRKFLRREKARIRRDILGSAEAEEKVKELVQRIFQEHDKRGLKAK